MGQLTFQATLGGAVNLVGPNTASTTSFTLPSADGTSGQALTTNGSGTLAFGTLGVTAGGTGVTTSTGSGSNVLSASPTLTGDVTLNAQGDLRFADSDSSNWVAFQAPATIASNVTWTLPSADGTSNQVLSTNGSGVLSWATAGGGSVAGSDTQIQYNNSGAFGASSLFTFNKSTTAPEITIGGASGVTSTTLKLRAPSATNGPYVGFSLANADAAVFWTHDSVGNFPLRFVAAGTEYGRFATAGYFKATNSGSYPDGNNTLNHYFNSNNATNSTVFIRGDSSSLSGTEVLFIRGNTNTTNNTYRLIGANNGNDSGRFQVQDSGNVVNTNNSYGSISDEKLKQDIIDASSQWNDIKNVRVRKFRFKNNPTGPLILGVIAQELETVSAGLIEQEQDFEDVQVPVLDSENNPVLDENGNVQTQKQRNMLETTTKSVKYSVLYMKAVKALQEAMARIEQLETRLDSANL